MEYFFLFCQSTFFSYLLAFGEGEETRVHSRVTVLDRITVDFYDEKHFKKHICVLLIKYLKLIFRSGAAAGQS